MSEISPAEYAALVEWSKGDANTASMLAAVRAALAMAEVARAA